MLDKKCGSAFFKDRGDIDCGCGWGELCTSRPVTHIVQAYAGGIGWTDCKKAVSLEDAQRQETELKANDKAWMSGTVERKTRVVPVEQANCKY